MTLAGMTHRFINVDLLTADYRVFGKVMIGSSGLLGLLTDTTRTIVEVKQAQIAYMHQPHRMVRQFDSIRFNKDRLCIACMDRRDDIGPQSIAHRGYTNYARYPMYVAVGGFEVDLSLEWTGRFDLTSILAENMNAFVPGYNATITSSLMDTFCIQTQAVLVNFHLVAIVAQSPDTAASAN